MLTPSRREYPHSSSRATRGRNARCASPPRGACSASAALFSVMQLALLLARSWFILHLNNPIGGHVLASLLTALAVELMQAAFHPLVEALCEWQNHRSAHIYERHHAAQLFSLSFINRFFTPLYLALLKKLGAFALFHGGAYPLTLAAATMSYLFGTDHPGSYLLEICRDRQGLPSDGCVEELATQIGALLLVQLLVQNAFEYVRLLLQQRLAPRGRLGWSGLPRSHALARPALPAPTFRAHHVVRHGRALRRRLPPRRSHRAPQQCHRGAHRLVQDATLRTAPSAAPRDAHGHVARDLALHHTLLDPDQHGARLPLHHRSSDAPRSASGRAVRPRPHSRAFAAGDQASHRLGHPRRARRTAAAPRAPAPSAWPRRARSRQGRRRRRRAAAPPPRRPTLRSRRAGGEAEAEDDIDPAERRREEKMSDRGLLRSFKPVAEERLPLEKEELDRQMQEAAGAGGERADSDKARRRAVKTRRKLVRQLSWTPHHAFARASARPACTDVVCLLPLLLLWLVMLAVAVQGGKYGHPTRLLFGMDYERNTCGVRNWGGVLRFGLERSSSFPYEVFLPNARFAPNVTAERQAELSRRNLTTGMRDFSGADGSISLLSSVGGDGGGSTEWYHPLKGSRSYVYYADPALRIGMCVSECPAPASLEEGKEPNNLMCSYDTPRAPPPPPGTGPSPPPLTLAQSYEQLPGPLPRVGSAGYNDTLSDRWCYPSYKTVPVAGYCVPERADPDWKYEKHEMTFTDVDLNDLRADLLRASNGRYFDAMFGDLVTIWPLMVGIPLVAGLVAIGWTALLPVAPTALYLTSVVMITASLSGLTYVFWFEGDERLSQAQALGIHTDFYPECHDDLDYYNHLGKGRNACGYASHATEIALWLKNTGQCLCALTLLQLPLAALGLLLLQPALPLLEASGPLLINLAPTALVPPALAMLAILLFACIWTICGAFVAASGELEINEHGHGRLAYTSGVKALFLVHVAGGLWTALFIKHFGQIGSAGTLGRAYWRNAEMQLERLGPGRLRKLLSPFLHVGSAAFGATACTLLESFAFCAQQCTSGPSSSRLAAALSRFQKIGYVNVALFGTSLFDGSRWATLNTRRFAPQVLQLQGRLSVLLFISKFAFSVSGAAVASAFLVGDPNLTKPLPFTHDGGVSSVFVPILAIFFLTWLVTSTLLSTVELTVSAGVQNWCLDFKQNCDDMDLRGSTWMMAIGEVPQLQPLPTSCATNASSPSRSLQGAARALRKGWQGRRGRQGRRARRRRRRQGRQWEKGGQERPKLSRRSLRQS